MPRPLHIAAAIEHVTGTIGRGVAWLSLVVVLAQFAVVVLRYGFNVGSLWLQESVIYFHAALFMLAAAWTLREGGHVRVDIFYAGATPRRKAVIDLFGAVLFLIPFAVTLLVLSLPYVARSWTILERSRETSGLPLVFLLKTLIPAFAVLMAVQGVAQGLRAVMLLLSRQSSER